MKISSNHKLSGRKYDDITIVEVWKKAIPVSQFELYKKDIFGSLMFFDDLGIESEMGWVISCKQSNQVCSKDEIENLQPVHWKNMKKIENEN